MLFKPCFHVQKKKKNYPKVINTKTEFKMLSKMLYAESTQLSFHNLNLRIINLLQRFI